MMEPIVLGFIGLCWVVLDFPRFYWVFLKFTWVLPRVFWALLGFTGFYWVILVYPGLNWFILGYLQ